MQCDQIWKVLVTNFHTKVAKIFCNILGNFEKSLIKVKTTVATLYANFGNIWLLFIPTSGHTGSIIISSSAYLSLYS